jgi:hypothetical protein
VKFVVETAIARPSAEAFDRMADARNEPAWDASFKAFCESG